MDNKNPLGAEGETTLEQDHQKSPDELQYAHEKEAFTSHMATSGDAVPDNFSDAGTYFDSLKEAHKQFTQTQQESSELRTQLDELKNKPQQAPLTDQLRIPNPSELPPEPEKAVGVDEATYESWAMEFATSGDFSETTRSDIKSRTGFSDRMVGDYVEAQKAKLREGYSKASVVVGGADKLDQIFKWATNNLTSQDMQSVNVGLASPSYEITLRGLASLYDGRVTEDKSKEPRTNPNLTQVAASQTGVLPYTNKREFTAERNDPKFQLEPSYRDVVQKRMSITDWNTLPA